MTEASFECLSGSKCSYSSYHFSSNSLEAEADSFVNGRSVAIPTLHFKLFSLLIINTFCFYKF